ncbi:acetyl-CoA carboxylase biotin carboxyl carrier protein [uncultured Gammaproteobacteria bacterium]
MAGFDIDSDLIRTLAELLRENGLTELEVADGERRIRLTRGGGVATTTVHALPYAAGPVLAPVKSAGPPVNAVNSPMVGTAYVAAEPGGTPFVKVGDQIKAGQTVLIIEAMKVMNPIKSPRSGIVSQVLVVDAQPVEFGEALIIID